MTDTNPTVPGVPGAVTPPVSTSRRRVPARPWENPISRHPSMFRPPGPPQATARSRAIP